MFSFGLTLALNIIGNETATENDQIKTILDLRCLATPKFFNGFIMWFLRSMAIADRSMKTAAHVVFRQNDIALHSALDIKREFVIEVKIFKTAITVL